MKKIIVLLAILVSVFSSAQNVGIGTNSPASKLTLDGNNPDIGFMNNGLAHGFIKASGSDFIINTASDNPVGKIILGTKDNNHFNIDYQGRVSIGTNSSFNANLKLNGSSPIFGFLNDDVQKGFLRLTGDNFKMGTYPGNSGKIVFSPKNVDKIWIDEEGQLGIGTSTPVSELTIGGTNTSIQFQSGILNKGFLRLAGDSLKIGTNSTNTTGNLVMQTKSIDRMLIDENGQVGIGTSNPTSILSINSNDPIVQLKNNTVDKGFVQLVGDDIKIGTNLSNDFGRFIIRTNGSDRVTVDNTGRVGIGKVASYPLDVNGTARFSGDLIADGDGSSSAYTLSSANPVLNFDETDFGLFIGANIKTENGALKIGKNFNGGNIIIDANTSSGTKRFYLNKVNQFNFGSGIFANGYTLSVEGKVIGTDFTTQAVGNWPDYVFGENYNLRPLSEVKKFIDENKHLPNIPSAAQIEKEGIQLGEMSKKLMEKIEELTLYILHQQQQIDELKKLVQSQKSN